MKIVHIGYWHRPDDIRIFQKECCSLAKCGYEVLYVTSNRKGETLNGEYSNVRIITISLPYKNMKRSFFFFIRKLKRVLISLDADVYHFHEDILMPVLLYMKKHGKHVIYDLHEDTPRNMQPSLCKRRGKLLGNLLTNIIEIYENYCIRKADYVVTATPHIAKRCKKLTNTVSCIANFPIIYNNGICVKPFKERERIICYTGGITERNGIFNIIEAMQQVEGTLYLAGGLSKELKDRLIKYSSWEKVCELGYVNKEAVQDIFQKSMAGLVLYLPEGNTVEALPNKLFEYMEAGIPVIASDFPLWRKIVEEGQCGICVDPNNPEEIADSINRILGNPQWAEEMGRNGKRLVQEKYNWGGQEKKLIKIYGEIF